APDQQQPAAAGGQAGAGGIGSIRRAHQRFSATRNTALRARGLAAISAAEGLMALPISFRLTLISASRIGRLRGSGSPLASRRMNCLTWRSSSEWKLITARRPPGASTASAACSPSARSSSSRLMKMRMPWKARVAGCLCFSQAGLACLITSARSAVVVNGCSARRATIARALRPLGQRLALAVDEDADAVEGTGGRRLVLFPGRVGLLDHLGQIGGGGKRLFRTAGHEGARHAAGEALLAVLVQHGGDIRLVGTIDPVGSALAGGGIHAHVQRAIVEETEAATRVIQLRRGDAQVQQDAVHLPQQATGLQLVGHLGKRALYNDKAAVFGRQLISDPD